MDLSMLEQQVMLAILRLTPTAYGVSIGREIEQRVGRGPSVGAIYATLDRLEDKGYVVSKRGEPTGERGGKARLYFELTAPGQATLQRSLQALASMQRGLRLKGVPA